MELHLDGLLNDHRHLWVMEITFQRIMSNVRRSLRSALEQLAVDPDLTVTRPSPLSTDPETLNAVLGRVRSERIGQVAVTYPNETGATRDELCATALEQLPGWGVVEARIATYNTLIDGFNGALTAVEQARGASDYRHAKVLVTDFVREHAAEAA